jgi:integrase
MNNSFNYSYDNNLPQKDAFVDGGCEKKIGENFMGHTLQDYQVYLAVHKRKEYTRRYYYDTIHKLLSDTNKTVQTLEKKDIDLWVACQNKRNLSHNTIQNYIIRINLFLQWLGKKEWNLKRIGWKDTNRNILTLQEIIQIRNTAKKLSSEHHLIILFITDLAARPNEICRAKFSNIIGNKIYFNDAKTGNTYGFITMDFQQALYEYQKIRPNPKPEYKDYILINNNGNKFCPKSQHIRTLLRQVTKKINLPQRITPYDLRSSVGTQEFNMFVNPKVIQRKFRHRNLNTTMKYNHVDDQMTEDYANNGLIFNNPSLFKGSKQKLGINNYLYNNTCPQDLNNMMDENDNSTFSFSFSFNEFLSTTIFPNVFGVGVAA